MPHGQLSLERRSLLLLTVPLIATALFAAATLAGGRDEFAAPLAWKKLAAGASPRFALSAVFDPKRECVLVYGGESNVQGQFGIQGDVWEYAPKSDSWKQVAGGGGAPPSRAYHAAAFDEKRGVMWVFGGASAKLTALDDLWKLDTATMTWTALKPSGEKPGARFSPGLHFDAARDQLVLYGGCKAFFSADNAWPEVWTYDIAQNAWSKKKAAAPARWQAASVLAPELDELIVQGGFDGNSTAHADTWSYSLADDKWSELGKGFKATEAHAAAWDPIAHAMLVYGGTSGAKAGLDQLWVFAPKTKKWSQLAVKGDGPGSRAYHALVWNGGDKSLWTFGGTLNQFMDEPRTSEAWSLQLHR